MSLRDDLGVRMKTFYEEIPKTRLMRRTPVAIRLDGKSFYTFTKGLQNLLIPISKGDAREYIDSLINVGEE